MARALFPECDCPYCSAPWSTDVLVSVRAKATKAIICGKLMTGFTGPTWITRWIIRQANSVGLVAGEYEYRIGKNGVWQL